MRTLPQWACVKTELLSTSSQDTERGNRKGEGFTMSPHVCTLCAGHIDGGIMLRSTDSRLCKG